MSSKPSRWAKVKNIVSVPSLGKSAKKRKDSKDLSTNTVTGTVTPAASQQDNSARPSQEAPQARASPAPVLSASPQITPQPTSQVTPPAPQPTSPPPPVSQPEPEAQTTPVQVPVQTPAPTAAPVPLSESEVVAEPTTKSDQVSVEFNDVKEVIQKTSTPSTASLEESQLYTEATKEVQAPSVPVSVPAPTPVPVSASDLPQAAPAPEQEWTEVPSPEPITSSEPSPAPAESKSAGQTSSAPLPSSQPQPEPEILNANVKEISSAQMTELISELEKRDVELKSARDENTTLSRKVEEILKQVSALQGKTQSLEDEARQNGGRVAELERVLGEEKEKSKKSVEDAQNRLAKATQRITELEGLHKSQTQKSTDLVRELSEAKKVQEGLKKRNGEIEQENRRHLDRVKVLESKATKLEGEQNVKGKEKKSLEGELGRLRSQVTTLEASLSRLRTDNDSLARASEKDAYEKERSLSEHKQKLDASEKEKHDIISRFEQEIAKVTTEMEKRILDEREAKDKEVAESRKERSVIAQRTEVALEAAARQKAELQDRLRDQDNDLQEARKRIVLLESSRNQAPSQPQEQPNKKRLEELERQNRMLSDQVRRQALHAQHKKLSSTNGHSVLLVRTRETEISSVATKLNGEIFQLSAYMADAIEFAGSGVLPGAMRTSVEERASMTIGRPLVTAMADIAAKLTDGHDPFAVQIALQACMTKCCAKIAGSWYPGHWDYSYFLETLYERVRNTDPTSATQWRSTTQSLLKPSIDDDINASLRMWLGSNVADVLIVSGWYEADEMKAQSVCSPFADALGRIVSLALQLNAMTGEEYEVATVDADQKYNPDSMEDAYDDMESNLAGEQVLCSVGLGVVSGRKSVLRPQVVLQTTFETETTYD